MKIYRQNKHGNTYREKSSHVEILLRIENCIFKIKHLFTSIITLLKTNFIKFKKNWYQNEFITNSSISNK